MKRLIVMRHAKSSWTSDAGTDHARPLNERGRRDAPLVGTALAERGWTPELVLSSDSTRTRETFDGLVSAFGEVDVTFTRDLYHAGATEVVSACEALDDSIGCVMVLGHNPGWEHVVGYLTGEFVSMTTGNCVLLEAEGTWMELMTSGAWELKEILRPRELS